MCTKKKRSGIGCSSYWFDVVKSILQSRGSKKNNNNNTFNAAAAARILPNNYSHSQLLTYLISTSDYYKMLISNDKALQQLRDEAGLSVTKSILKPKESTNTLNATARTSVGVYRSVLSNAIEQLTDVSSIESDKIISRLIRVGRLLEIPQASFESDSTVVLNY
jgi:hypothetical protein